MSWEIYSTNLPLFDDLRTSQQFYTILHRSSSVSVLKSQCPGQCPQKRPNMCQKSASKASASSKVSVPVSVLKKDLICVKRVPLKRQRPQTSVSWYRYYRTLQNVTYITTEPHLYYYRTSLILLQNVTYIEDFGKRLRTSDPMQFWRSPRSAANQTCYKVDLILVKWI